MEGSKDGDGVDFVDVHQCALEGTVFQLAFGLLEGVTSGVL